MSVQGVRDVLHDDVGGITLHLEVMDPGDVGVVQTSGQPGLLLEGFQIGGVIGDGLVDDLYGHYPVQDGIPVPVDRPLAAIRSRSSYLPIRWSMVASIVPCPFWWAAT